MRKYFLRSLFVLLLLFTLSIAKALSHYHVMHSDSAHHVSDPVILDVQIGENANEYIEVQRDNQVLDTIMVPDEAEGFSIAISLMDPYREGYNLYYRVAPSMHNYRKVPRSGEISLSELSGGHQTLSVLVQSEDKSMQQKVSWHLYKPPAFVETGFFYILISLSIVGFTAFMIYEKSEKLRSERRLRNQISRDLHDEVGGLLTGISMQAQLLRMQESGTNEREKSLTRISAYSRDAIQMMDDIIWAIDVRNNQRGSLEDRMKFLANQMVPSLSMSVIYDMDHHNERKIPHSIRQSLYLIYKEALHNACKHGAAGTIYVALHIQKNTVMMSVRNQVGYPKAPELPSVEQRKGQGQFNMRIRASQIGATLTSGRVGQEYVVEVVAPLRQRFFHFLSTLKVN